MRRIDVVFAFGVTPMLFGSVASPVWAQEGSCRAAPGISVYYAPGVTEGISYISSHIRASESAYVFAVEIDLNGEVEVLYPNSPNDSSKVVADRPIAMPSFFSGFGGSMGPTQRGLRGTVTSRGVIFALASCAPFSLDRIVTDGEWNIDVIERLVRQQNPQTAIAVLANYLAANGQEVGHSMMSFNGGTNYNYPRISEPFLQHF